MMIGQSYRTLQREFYLYSPRKKNCLFFFSCSWEQEGETFFFFSNKEWHLFTIKTNTNGSSPFVLKEFSLMITKDHKIYHLYTDGYYHEVYKLILSLILQLFRQNTPLLCVSVCSSRKQVWNESGLKVLLQAIIFLHRMD